MNTDWLSNYVSEVRITYYSDETACCTTSSGSLDVNDHIDEVYSLIVEKGLPRGGYIDICYRGKRMFIGDGPRLSRAAIKLLAELDAEVGQDIYCACNEMEPQSGQQCAMPDSGTDGV